MRTGFAIALGVLGLWLAFVAFAVLARFAIHGPVDRESLHIALERESHSAGDLLDSPGGCHRTQQPREWRCSVIDRSGSGGADYRVWLDGDSSCWHARRIGTGSMPRRVHGCVYLWQWQLFS